MKIVIKNGTVVTSEGRVSADVLVDGERVVSLSASGSHTWEESADRVIDASGKYVLPGGVDASSQIGQEDPEVMIYGFPCHQVMKTGMNQNLFQVR